MHLLDILPIDWVQRFGWMLLHSLWQMAAVAALLALALRRLRRGSASARYAAACAGMALMVILPLATAICVQPRFTATPPPAAVGGALAQPALDHVGDNRSTPGDGNADPAQATHRRPRDTHGSRKPRPSTVCPRRSFPGCRNLWPPGWPA